MSTYEREYVSRLVPKTRRGLMGVLLAVVVVNSAVLGYDASVMNGLNILPSYTEYFNLTTTTTSLNTAAAWMGNIVGALLAAPVADKFGRRMTIVLSALIIFVGTILQTAAQNIGMFIAARIIVGMGTMMGNSGGPTLVAELMPAHTRGRMLGIFFSCYYVGSLLSSIVNYGSANIDSTWSWRLSSLLMFVPSAIALALHPMCPESPRYLISKGEMAHAREVLIVMQGERTSETAAEADMSSIRAIMAKEAEEQPQNPWIEIFATTGNRKRLFICASFGIMLELFGNFVVSFYLTTLLDSAGITNTTTQTQINVILNCWCFIVAIVGSFTLDIIGRRPQALISIVGMTVTLYMTGGLIKEYGTSTNTSGIYGTIAVVFLFQGFYSFAITPLTSVYPVEIANFKLRATCVAVFRFFDCGCGLMASFVMNLAMKKLGWKFYMVNASWDVFFGLIVYLTWPETKGKSLEAMATFFEGPQLIEAALEEDSGKDYVKDDVYQSKGEVGVSAVAK